MRIQEPDLAELRRIFRELELVSLYKEVRMEDKDVPHPEASELRDVLAGTISVVARIHGRCPFDVTLDRFAVSNGTEVFYSEDDRRPLLRPLLGPRGDRL